MKRLNQEGPPHQNEPENEGSTEESEDKQWRDLSSYRMCVSLDPTVPEV